MEIVFRNKQQVKIADLLWDAQDQKAVDLVLKTFGHDAYVVYHMLIAYTMDQVNDTDLAESVLNKILKE